MQKSWTDFYNAALAAGTDDASACHQADEAMRKQEPELPYLPDCVSCVGVHTCNRTAS